MALKGLDIFKLTPKTNCKECGNPTCMAFAMKVAQGAIPIEKCPHMSDDAKATLSEATAPPMKSLKFGTGETEHTLGGETVLFRHDKTFVSHNLFGVNVCPGCFDDRIGEVEKVSYERIGEHMYTEVLNLGFKGDQAAYVELVKKAMGHNRALILECTDAAAAAAALDVCADAKPILNGATPDNYKEMAELAKAKGVLLGVSAPDLDALYDTTAAIEGLGYKDLVLDVTGATVRDTYANAIQVRRAALKDKDRTFGYPSIVNLGKIAAGDVTKQTALASMFVLKYGSIILMDGMSYAQALPLFGLRQNIYTDPQKPMKVEPGIYALNGATADSPCATTVDFALTYFIVSGELERSGVPVNLLISDAGGYSVLTAWAAGKFSAGSIAKFFKEQDIEGKITSRDLIIPGKAAVLKGELEEQLPGWNIIVAPNEATGLVKFMKDLKA
ncbi:MAG: acetyl-CoA decarbonylase/synthase complex subunit gamma [Ruminococcaceae bacterium]|jgi:acetyl-CoA decarbonylase/synthase complex subunit gamma|nr:acetyl-CoA decarbonylase/synthase complex subunit gamma [Oscillospiraceae bacterium]